MGCLFVIVLLDPIFLYEAFILTVFLSFCCCSQH